MQKDGPFVRGNVDVVGILNTLVLLLIDTGGDLLVSTIIFANTNGDCETLYDL